MFFDDKKNFTCADCKYHTCKCSCMTKEKKCKSYCLKKKSASQCNRRVCKDFKYERINICL